MKIIIHCGAYKTGSSSIQNYFHKNRQFILEKYNGIYPTAGLFYSKEIGYRHTKLFYSYGKPEWDKHIQDMKDQLLEGKLKGVKFAVISSEALSNPIIHNSLKAFISLLNEWGFNDVSGIGYVRNLYDYILRHYREFTLRHKNQKKINGWIKKNEHVFNYPLVFCDLNDIFNNNFTLCLYEESGSTLHDFCNRIGINNLEYIQPKRVNGGLNAIDIEINRLANTKGIKHKGLRLISAVEEVLGEDFTRSLSELPAVVESDDWVAKQNWEKFQSTFSLSDKQLKKVIEKPNITGTRNIYDVSNVLNKFLVDLGN